MIVNMLEKASFIFPDLEEVLSLAIELTDLFGIDFDDNYDIVVHAATGLCIEVVALSICVALGA